MLCSNCGKEIPFLRRVCPHCHADTQSGEGARDNLALSVISLTFVGLLIGGGIGYYADGPFLAVVYGVVGAICLGIVAITISAVLKE